MRIGVDARNLVPNLSGIGRYVIEMVKALGSMGHELVLYMPEPPYKPLPELPCCELRIENYRGPWRRVIWSMTALPRAANRDSLDVFWGPAHRLPPNLNLNLPRVVTIHDLVWQKAPHTMRWQTWLGERFFMGPALRNADAIVADTVATAVDLAEYYPNSNNTIDVVYPGLTKLSSRASHLPQRRQLEQALPYALFVGTLEPRKNLPTLLQAFKLLTTSNVTQLNLVIAGGQGWRSNHVSSLIQEHGIEHRVKMTGFVSDEELAELYMSAEFLIMPSLYEGFGFPIIEAQSFGTPVITSDRSSMPEITCGSAILIDPNDPSQIAAAITQLHHDTSLQQALAEKSIQNAERFSWPSAARDLTKIFERICHKNS